MIDWHSHVLPGMDDGSRDINESLAMLRALGDQGVQTVIATPHFYANEESVDSFLERREERYGLLCKSDDGTFPHVICGAEVRYYPCISRMKDLELLTVKGTKLLLLEMPMARWTEYTVKELIELVSLRRLTVILAHIERYLVFQKKGTFERLLESGLMMQVNASFFDKIGNRRKAFALLDSGMIHFIGSDSHNMTSRPPKLGRAYELIERRFGEDYVFQMNEFSNRALKNNSI
jgi:protein-tyrosine phosphatase